MATRRRQFGSVRKLPSRRYQARYIGPDGKRHGAPRTFTTRSEAARWLARVETDLDQGSWISPSLGGVGVGAYIKSWITARRTSGRPLAPRTRSTYRHSLDRWIYPTFGETPLGRVTPAAVRAWYSDVATRGGRTAARQAYALLHAAYRTAVDDGLVLRNPCRIPGAGVATSPRRPLLSDREVQQLIRSMPKHLHALVVLAFFGQLRPGELLGLERRDMDLANRRLSVRRQVVEVEGQPMTVSPKWSSDRTIQLPQQAVEALRRHLEAQPPGLPTARVFVRADGSQLREHHIHAAWSSARMRAGLPHARLYDLRHAGLTAASQEGATMAEVMRRAGHSTFRAAMIYQHAADDRDEEVAVRLGARGASSDWTA